MTLKMTRISTNGELLWLTKTHGLRKWLMSIVYWSSLFVHPVVLREVIFHWFPHQSFGESEVKKDSWCEMQTGKPPRYISSGLCRNENDLIIFSLSVTSIPFIFIDRTRGIDGTAPLKRYPAPQNNDNNNNEWMPQSLSPVHDAIHHWWKCVAYQ